MAEYKSMLVTQARTAPENMLVELNGLIAPPRTILETNSVFDRRIEFWFRDRTGMVLVGLLDSYLSSMEQYRSMYESKNDETTILGFTHFLEAVSFSRLEVTINGEVLASEKDNIGMVGDGNSFNRLYLHNLRTDGRDITFYKP